MTDVTDAAAPEAPPKGYRTDGAGNLIREENIPPRALWEDEAVERICWFGDALSRSICRFLDRSLDDIDALRARLLEEYEADPAKARLGGKKGNISLHSFDRRRRVVLAVADRVEVGPEIEAAAALIRECLDDWTERCRLELRALVEAAFRADESGRLSVAALLQLRRTEIGDPRWRMVQQAISDAVRPVGTAQYLRIYERDTSADPWRQVPLNLASARRRGGDGGDPREELVRRARRAVEEARHCGLSQADIGEALAEAKRLRAKPKAEAADAPA